MLRQLGEILKGRLYKPEDCNYSSRPCQKARLPQTPAFTLWSLEKGIYECIRYGKRKKILLNYWHFIINYYYFLYIGLSCRTFWSAQYKTLMVFNCPLAYNSVSTSHISLCMKQRFLSEGNNGLLLIQMTLIYNFTSVSILPYFFSQWVENINKNLPLGYMFILMVKCNTCLSLFFN